MTASSPKIIAIAGFQHETNSFGMTTAGYDDFVMADSWPGMLIGDEVLPGVDGMTLPLAGFVKEARKHNSITLKPILWCSAEPSSFVEDDAFEKISSMIIQELEAMDNLDGIYLDLHGAMVTQSHDDGEGELLRRIRSVMGNDIPISISLDSHANITPAMVDHASSITVFRSYPHLDMAETGARALTALLPLMGGQTRAFAFRQSPFLIPMQDQYSELPAFVDFYNALRDADNAPHAWAELATGFPAADHVNVGPSIVTQAPDAETANALADRLMDELLKLETGITPSLIPGKEAVREAITMAKTSAKPILIADVQDNAGAGSTSDTTGLLHELIDQQASGVMLAMLHDPEMASLAHEHGVGAIIKGQLGGKIDPDSTPISGEFEVVALSDGLFDFTGEMYRGCHADAGLCAVLKPLGHDIAAVISSKRCQCLDQAIFTHIGLNPHEASILVLKSTVHFRADFEEISDVVLNASSPGRTPCDLPQAGFTRLREGIRLGPKGLPHKSPPKGPRFTPSK